MLIDVLLNRLLRKDFVIAERLVFSNAKNGLVLAVSTVLSVHGQGLLVKESLETGFGFVALKGSHPHRHLHGPVVRTGDKTGVIIVLAVVFAIS